MALIPGLSLRDVGDLAVQSSAAYAVLDSNQHVQYVFANHSASLAA